MSDDSLMHEGRSIKDGAPGVGSGRYPLGSGESPYQHYKDFRYSVLGMRKAGMSNKDIAKAKGMSINELLAKTAMAKKYVDIANISYVYDAKSRGMSNTAIAEKLGVTEGTVRNYLKEGAVEKAESITSAANALKEAVAANTYVDVGKGTELWMGMSDRKKKDALIQLQEEGYTVHNIKVTQVGTGENTTVSVLAPPGATLKEVSQNRHLIKPAGVYSEDQGHTYRTISQPKSLSSDRVSICYAEDGGIKKDGVIELRPGVDDISLGRAKYAQVRIAVDGTHYLKGMAVYGDPKSFPEGVDIIFNTNKKKGTPKIDADKGVLKPLEIDKETGKISKTNPFKASIKDDDVLILAQRHYIDKNGKEQQSCLNIVNEEGNWGQWSKNLASQFLSKQDVSLAKRQLNLAFAKKRDEFEEINSLTNPEIKRKLLMDFADNCDSAAVSLKAAAMPGQQTHVILPYPTMKADQCYAPNYDNGEKLALVRYPHGGVFEIPIVQVNNNFGPAKKNLKNAPDAIGINYKVAEQLSGADFDGDTVIAIPIKNQKIISKKPLEGLKNFDPKAQYPKYDGMPIMSEKLKQREMGIISNLITDMSLKGATDSELERAVRHSMVVIDAKKHKLNWKQSYKDNNILELKKKYQYDPETGKSGGASTLISKASSEERVLDRKPALTVKGKVQYGIDINTGEKVYEPTGKTVFNKSKGEYVLKTKKSTKMAEAKDARNLISKDKPTLMEQIYADYANKLKSMGNSARLAYLRTPTTKMNPEAKKKYASEVSSLKAKVNKALMNKPLERQAQILANYNIRLRLQNNPDLDKDDKKKIKAQELDLARRRVGAKKDPVEITDKEWEAMQSGACSSNLLTQIVNNTDTDLLKARATPRSTTSIPTAKLSRAKAMLSAGHTQAEVAAALGISVSSVNRIANS